MKEKFDRKSLKFKLWTYFVLFAATIMIILWLLQIVFLNTYYKSMKVSEVEKLGNRLVLEYGKESFEDIVYEESFDNGIYIQIFNEYGQQVFPNTGFLSMRLSRVEELAIKIFIDTLNKSDNNKVLYTVEDERLEKPTIVYGNILKGQDGNNLYLYINSLIDPIDSTIAVLKNQLIIVTILSLVMAIGISFVIASKISDPITKITDSATVLAKGNYTVVFEKGDYTEIDQLADTLNYTTKELSKTDELRKDLIANVSHDLRTPLTLIKSYAEMIRDISGDKPEKRDSHLSVIINESDRLAGMVNDILDLSKVESDLAYIEKEEFNIVDMTEDILQRFRILVDTEDYKFNIKSNKNISVLADRKKIEQVIYNLIGNAVNYTGEDKKIYIEILEETNKIRYEIKDTGKGIAEEEINNIWDKYYRAGKTHKRAILGTGLGLSIVKNILNAHKANFGVNSIVNQGTTFWFELEKV